MSCSNYDSCIQRERHNLRHPVDKKSLYANRVYDNQTANRRCYEGSPINIEGFGCPSRETINTLIRWAVIALVVYIIFSFVAGGQNPFTTQQIGGIIPPMSPPPPTLLGGGEFDSIFGL